MNCDYCVRCKGPLKARSNFSFSCANRSNDCTEVVIKCWNCKSIKRCAYIINSYNCHCGSFMHERTNTVGTHFYNNDVDVLVTYSLNNYILSIILTNAHDYYNRSKTEFNRYVIIDPNKLTRIRLKFEAKKIEKVAILL